MRCLVNNQDVHLGSLEALSVLIVVEVSEQYSAAVGEDYVLLAVIVGSKPL